MLLEFLKIIAWTGMIVVATFWIWLPILCLIADQMAPASNPPFKTMVTGAELSENISNHARQ